MPDSPFCSLRVSTEAKRKKKQLVA